MASSAIQELHDLEVQGAIGWPVLGKIIVRIGCPLENRFIDEALVTTFHDAEAWLRKTQGIPASSAPGPKHASVVDKLFAAGVPASALWIYDRMFQATLAPPDDTSVSDHWLRASSWAELEDKMWAEARERFALSWKVPSTAAWLGLRGS
jgi:hypothetical protein